MTKILIIEDERVLRKSLYRILTEAGFEVIEAENGKMGLNLIQMQNPELILCDLMMPEMDGYSLLRELQKDSATATIPFICLTAKDERATLRKLMELGADDYITKPFTKAELLGAIEAQLAKREKLKQKNAETFQQAIVDLNNHLYYDSLTNLPNRLLLQERFGKLIAASDDRNLLVSIAILNFDQFERFQESLGIYHVDLLFREVIDRLIANIGEAGMALRLNNEQIAVILPPVKDKQALAAVVQNLRDIIAQAPFILLGYEISVTASIGLAVYPKHGKDFNTLLNNANVAVRRAKQLGSNQYQLYRYELYTESIQAQSKRRVMLELSLHQAIEDNQFEVYYQPLINLKTGKIASAEALIRWNHPERGFISPAEFIPIAEQTGLILAVDEWVIKAVCQQLKIWQRSGQNFSVAVNLSALQFNQPDLTQRILEILENIDLPSNYLELELTETALVQNPDKALVILKQLKTLGLKLSLDDFGIGYSSLGYLQQFSFDKLKIDRSFITNIHKNPKNAAIAIAVMQMARSLNLTVVAEGVETQEEKDFLQKHNCDLIQGYLISPPVTLARFEEMLAGDRFISTQQSEF